MNFLRITVRSMMGDFGGHSALLEITKKEQADESSIPEYEYSVFVLSFFTTDEIIIKFVILLGWLAVSFFTFLLFRRCSASPKLKTD